MKNLSIAAFTLLLIVSSCKKEAKNELDNSKNNNTKSESILANYEIAINESFQLVLKSNPTTGYSWKWVNKQSVSIVDSFDFSYICDNSSLIGSGGKEIWHFKGIKTGIDTIKLEYNRSWEANSTIESKTIIVKVK